MKSPSQRSRTWVSACAIGAVGLAAGVIALAQDSGRGPSPVTPPGGLRFVRVSPAQPVITLRVFDFCLVQAPDVDPGFVIPAREIDESMIVPSRVAGLYGGTLRRRP